MEWIDNIDKILKRYRDWSRTGEEYEVKEEYTEENGKHIKFVNYIEKDFKPKLGNVKRRETVSGVIIQTIIEVNKVK